MTTLAQLERWVTLGESETQEFKRSTANLERGTQTICGMLNRQGGRVMYGVRPEAPWKANRPQTAHWKRSAGNWP